MPPERQHRELIFRLAAIKKQQYKLSQDTQSFLNDANAAEKAEVIKSVLDLRSLTPEVTVLCAQTGAVVERIANANDVAEKMTREVRRLDVIQSRLTTTLSQSAQLLSLRNAFTGIRRAMQLQNYPEAATFLKQLKEIEQVMPLDVADKLRVETIESDLKGIIEASFHDGLHTNDRIKVYTYAPLFQIVSREYEELGFQQLLTHVVSGLNTQLAPMQKGAFSTKELMEQLTTIFNRIASIAQEYEQILYQCFARVSGCHRLMVAIYAAGERTSVAILSAYMQQRKFRQIMDSAHTVDNQDSTIGKKNTQQLSPTALGQTGRSSLSTTASEDEIALLNEQLNEMALVVQHTQTYERFMRSRVVNTEEVEHRENEKDAAFVLPSSHDSELSKSVQELAGYYCYFENDLLNKAARKAFQWEELRFSSSTTVLMDTEASSLTSDTANNDSGDMVCFPISSAIDEIFYVSRNSGLRALATGHADCAAGVLNMINTVLRDALGDVMRSRIRNMATYVKIDQEGGLLFASNQLREQVTQQFAKLSKIPQISTAVSTATGSSTTVQEMRKEVCPDVVMNSLEVTIEYITQLKGEFEHELQTDFPDIPTHLSTCLNALEDASTELAQLLLASRKKLCKVLETKLIANLSPLIAINTKKPVQYELTEQMFTWNEANDPFAHAFVVSLREILHMFRPTLSPTNFKKFVEALARTTVEIIERWFYSRHVRFNQLGALQFDKDVRVLSSFFNEHADCRVEFATITQIAMILNVDAPDDALDFYGRRSRGIEWKLSAAQVKEVLARRVEFSDTAINKLRLDV